MDDLLFLTHRIPYPPDKGDKIRSFHWLQGLSSRFRIHLATFIDDPRDEAHVDALHRYCESLHVVRLRRHRLALAALPAFARREALSLAVYRDAGLRAWLSDVCRRHSIVAALAFSSGVAPYLAAPELRTVRKVVDFVDVDSDKWRQYASGARWPKRWIYAREARCLVRDEARLARLSDVSVLVSPAEAALFGRQVSSRVPIEAIENGVDVEFFDPRRSYPNPYTHSKVLVFTGAMDYAANADAVNWFANEVFADVRERCPQAAFYIVGSNPSPSVRRLSELPGVVVTGRVPDVRPYLAHAAAAVAPLRLARGVQNKVLEALAMDRPVLATPQAVEGLEEGVSVIDAVTDCASDLAARAVALLQGGSPIEPGRRRAFVQQRYSWQRSVDRLSAALRDVVAGTRGADLTAGEISGMSSSIIQ
ncbi:MAG TPA: TIGR03087 family PEP-CTERM/XrtA system glycosyltransferase [Gammaproteobacteria bacterium]|nr:TIGR03087 family PEP-CTERM/XrtA system glycosyltransferase [Gammaproteobacteria bacterium]